MEQPKIQLIQYLRYSVQHSAPDFGIWNLEFGIWNPGTLEPSAIERQHQKHHDIPYRVADHVDQHGIVLQVEPAPEKPADQRGHDQHEVTGKDVDAGIEDEGNDKPGPFAGLCRDFLLQVPPPEQLFSRADHEDHQQGDPDAGCIAFEGVNVFNAGACEIKPSPR